jgi:transposase
VAEKPVKRHPHRKDYTEQERDAALIAYVRCGGHREKASEVLKAADIHVPPNTLYDWATKTQKDRLERIRQELGPQLKAEMAEMHQGLAVAAGEIEAKAIVRLNEKLDQNEIEAKDLSAVMQRSAIATGIHGEKHLLYSGQPTQIVQRPASEIIRKMRSRGLFIEAEVVGEEDVASASEQ